MCEQCVQIDKKIGDYQRMASRITDRPMLDGIKRLLGEMEAQKLALHREREA